MGSSYGSATWLALVVVLSALAWMERSFAEECSVEQEDVFCELPEVVDAATTGAHRFHPGHLILGYNPICKTFPHGPFRTADGTCNHLLNFGAANRPPKRLLPHAYGDIQGLEQPRTRDSSGMELPSPTLISRVVHPSIRAPQMFSVMMMQWGQFIDHDITGFPIASEQETPIFCCGANGEFPYFSVDRECFPIRLDPEDGRFRECMEFSRSVAARSKNGKKLLPREQINAVTSFVDGSMIYGSSLELQEELREKVRDELRAKMRVSQGDLLPRNPEEDCNHGPKEFCFLAGDSRVNEHPGLMAIHTLFVRIHNNIVDKLELVRPNDTPEEIFQIARKIVGAIVQNVHYGEWLPLVLGQATMLQFKLTTGQRVAYQPYLDPRIANAFSTAAFRFGHSLIPGAFVINGVRRRLRDLFGLTSPLFDDFDAVLLALTSPNQTGEVAGSEQRDRFFTEEVTDHLFETEEIRNLSNGLDLLALNIQRGRDHGLPPFNAYRKLCGLPIPKTFSDLPSPLDEIYASVYRSVEDIDLFSGLMSEPNEPDSMVGATLSCLLGMQFHALKFGDRFFFETERDEEGFTDGQLDNIRNMTMAHLCCQEKRIRKIQQRVFEIQDPVRNPFVKCKTLRQNFINFDLWENF